MELEENEAGNSAELAFERSARARARAHRHAEDHARDDCASAKAAEPHVRLAVLDLDRLVHKGEADGRDDSEDDDAARERDHGRAKRRAHVRLHRRVDAGLHGKDAPRSQGGNAAEHDDVPRPAHVDRVDCEAGTQREQHDTQDTKRRRTLALEHKQAEAVRQQAGRQLAQSGAELECGKAEGLRE
eukprot:2644073-Pleurochrysis_carterae.AAC.1